MKRYAIKLAIFVAIQAALVVAVLAVRPVSPKAYLYSVRDKYEIAESAPRPRMLMVGGSNLLMGVDSGMLDEAIPEYTPVNLGVHARLASDFMMAQAADIAEPGDLIVLCFEYAHYKEHQGHREITETAIYYDPRAWRYVGLRDMKAVLDTFHTVMNVSLEAIAHVILGGSVDPKGAYASGGLNRYGDEESHWTWRPKDETEAEAHFRNIAVHIRKHDSYIEHRSHYLAGLIDRMNAFDREMKARGCRTVLMFPAIPEELYRMKKQGRGGRTIAGEIKNIERDLRQGLEFPVLGEPGDTVMGQRLFYDSVYHLTREGVDRRTRVMVRLLRTYIDRRNSQ